MNLDINLENCYGIKKLNHTFNFSNSKNTHLIYAPNGTMKTSFAKTMKFLSGQSKDEPKDLVNPIIPSIKDITFDNNSVKKENIFVVNGDEEIDSSKSFTSFLASLELKQRYDSIYQLLKTNKDNLISKLKSISQSTDCEREILETFKNGDNDTIFSILERVSSSINNNKLFDFKYNAVFDKKGAVKKFIESNRDGLQTYIDKYNDLLSQSVLYRSINGHSFGTYQVDQLFLNISDFFEVEHKIVLQNGCEITSLEEFRKIKQEEQNKILANEDLRNTFDEITKAIDKNTELREFKSVIETAPELITEILNYEEFRKKVWLGYLAQGDVKALLDLYLDIYNQNKDELNDILLQASKEQDKWKDIIELYNTRFHVPIKVKIQNQRDIILKEESAKLHFYYIDNDNIEIEKEQKELYNILSRGEKRAFIILQFLFEMEARKLADDYTLVIMDDIADSFDYQNKYAIIEYIKDLAEEINNKFYLLILTHNYDFYRTIASRLKGTCPRNNIWMVNKKSNNEIELRRGQYVGNVFENVFVKHNEKDKIFISMIPFVRNLIEYTKGQSSPEYLKLTSCLHINEDTRKITESDVISILKDYTLGEEIKREVSDRSIYELIIGTADNIAQDSDLNPIDLENKIVLSIAIRLLAEEYMKKKLVEVGKKEEDFAAIRSNQTGELTKMYKDNCQFDSNKNIIEKVNMMTPEHIHINSFMFEPLIDVSVQHLVELYNHSKNILS
jgi:hypothetical protein